jgi:hypothetical protein
MENKHRSAFPRPKQVLGSGEDYHEIPASEGLTKREWFAGMALQGLLSATQYNEKHSAAKRAVETADAILKQLETPQP